MDCAVSGPPRSRSRRPWPCGHLCECSSNAIARGSRRWKLLSVKWPIVYIRKARLARSIYSTRDCLSRVPCTWNGFTTMQTNDAITVWRVVQMNLQAESLKGHVTWPVSALMFDVTISRHDTNVRSFVRSLSISATFETLSGNMCCIFVHSAQCSIFVRFLLIKNISLLQFIDRISALCCECKCWKVNVDSQLSNSVGLHSAILQNRFSCRVVCTSRPRNVV